MTADRLTPEREAEIRDHQARTDYRHIRDETAEVLDELDRCRASMTTNHGTWLKAEAELAALRADLAAAEQDRDEANNRAHHQMVSRRAALARVRVEAVAIIRALSDGPPDPQAILAARAWLRANHPSPEVYMAALRASAEPERAGGAGQ